MRASTGDAVATADPPSAAPAKAVLVPSIPISSAPPIAAVASRTPAALTVSAATPANPIQGIVLGLMKTVLGPFADANAAGHPIQTPLPWTLMAFASRVLGQSLLGGSPTAGSATGAAPTSETVSAATAAGPSMNGAPKTSVTVSEPSEPVFTGRPSISTQIFVAALRLLNPVFKLLGVDPGGSSASIPFVSDGIPPFFVTYGLKVASSEYDGWKVWTLTPARPTGQVVVGVHGGGFVMQASIFHWMAYADMARATGATVVVPQYPLAKTDGTGGTAATVVPVMADFIADQVAAHGANNVSVIGDSAGGTIALAAAQMLVQQCGTDLKCRARVLPGHLVLVSPALDSGLSNPDAAKIDDPLLNVARSQRNGKLWAAGLGTPEDPDGTKNPLASPLYGSLEGLPPTTVYAGSLDLRTPDVLVLQQRAAATPGADFSFELRNGMVHDWTFLPFLSDAIAARPSIYQHLGLR